VHDSSVRRIATITPDMIAPETDEEDRTIPRPACFTTSANQMKISPSGLDR
jgi:hypothetical protein